MAGDVMEPTSDQTTTNSVAQADGSRSEAPQGEAQNVEAVTGDSDLLQALGVGPGRQPIGAPPLADAEAALLTPEGARLVEEAAVSAGTTWDHLMETAGQGAAAVLVSAIGDPSDVDGPIFILCGTGGNGGDGFVMARALMQAGYRVTTRLVGARDAVLGSAAIMLEKLEQVGARVAPFDASELDKASIIVDALVGGGLKGALRDDIAESVASINQSDAYTFSIDVPSGLDARTGQISGAVVQADATVTFMRKRAGHVTAPGRYLCGGAAAIAVVDLGIDKALLTACNEQIFENTPQLWGGDYPQIGPAHHKYDRGHVLVLGGQEPALGAARLASQAALRLGAGLVTMAAPVETYAIQAGALTDVMVRRFENPFGFLGMLRDQRIDPVVIGPGAGVGAKTSEMVSGCIERDRNLVLDADALTSIAGKIATIFKDYERDVVLTPHDGEFSRLFPDIELADDRIGAALRAAKTANAIVTLKGVSTIVASPDGRVSVAANAPSWLSIGGTGDVLSGAVAGLMAQGMPGFEAASAAVWLHGEAAMRCGKGMLASDLLYAFKRVLP